MTALADSPDATRKTRPPLRQQVATGAMVLMVTRLLSRGVDLATLIVLARQLTPADFGLVAIAVSVVQITEAILEMPTGNALLQLKAVNRSHLNTAFTLALIRGLAIAAILCALSVPLAAFFGDPRLVALVCALSLAPGLRGLRSPKMFLLFKRMRFRPDAMAEVVGKLGALAIAVPLALATGSYWAIAAGTIASPLFYMLTTYLLVPSWPAVTLQGWRLFHRYLGWSMAAQFISALNWQSDRFVLGKLAAQATLGLFTTTRDLAATTYKVIFESIQRPILSALSRSNGDPARQRQLYGVSVSSVLSIGLPIACGQAYLGRELVELILGPRWLEGAFVFQAVSLTLIPGLYSSMVTTLLYACGKPEFIFTRNLYDFIFRIPATVACILLFGWKGAVAALVASDLALAVLCMHVARSAIGIGMLAQVGKAWRGAASVVVMIAVLEALGRIVPHGGGTAEIVLYLLKVVPVGAASYILAHWLIWQIAGKPDGVERAALDLIVRISAKVLRSSGAPLQSAVAKP